MISKVQEKIQKDWNSKTNICPNILHVDADAGVDPDEDADAVGIAIALLH